ncbi:MAG: formyltetrahydrofolate deformylase [Lentisphaeria bacterium]|nr:formyltetrahydrofolate deformylase [Lentisphaeria bacterium]
MIQAIFLIRSMDRKGLLSGISTYFYNRGFNILLCQQYTDDRENLYFMRVCVDITDMQTTRKEFSSSFAEFARTLSLEYSLNFSDTPQRVAILVSKTSHCLYDLLAHAQDEKDLGCEIPLIVSNHPDLESVADRFRIPYFCFPVVKGKELEQEKQILEQLDKHHIDLVVLARYMRILSKDFIDRYPGRIINIHHAFLPAFQGSDPYRRAWERGVKMIGATAHYATVDLDEGPIIEQDVERITHEAGPNDLKRIGKDIERRVLTRAVRAHLQHRIITSGRRTVVFSR